jgi:hypothetical protein
MIATKANGTTIPFGTITGFAGIQTVVGLGLHDALTGGVLRFAGVLDTARPFISGDNLTIGVGVCKITEGGGPLGGIIGDAQALAFLDAAIGSTTLGPGTYYVSMWTVMPTGVPGSGTEFISTGGSTYARIAKTNNSTNWPAAAMV